MKRLLFPASVTVATLLAGCAINPLTQAPVKQNSAANMPLPAASDAKPSSASGSSQASASDSSSSDGAALNAVQSDIKRQIGVYMLAVAHDELAPKEKAETTSFECGSGNIDYDITSVKVDLLVTGEGINKDGATGLIAKVLTPTLSGSKDTTATSELVYSIWPIEFKNQPKSFQGEAASFDPATLNGAPVARALLELRAALIKQASQTPCFTDFNLPSPSTDAGNSYKLSLNVVKDGSVGVGILAVLSGSVEAKETLGNTLTINFAQSHLKVVERISTDMTTLCTPETEAAVSGRKRASVKAGCDAAKRIFYGQEANVITLQADGKLVDKGIAALPSKLRPTNWQPDLLLPSSDTDKGPGKHIRKVADKGADKNPGVLSEPGGVLFGRTGNPVIPPNINVGVMEYKFSHPVTIPTAGQAPSSSSASSSSK